MESHPKHGGGENTRGLDPYEYKLHLNGASSNYRAEGRWNSGDYGIRFPQNGCVLRILNSLREVMTYIVTRDE